MAVLVLVRHGDDPPDDRVVTHLTARGFDLRTVRPFAGERLGVPGPDVVGSVIYGGLFNAYDTALHPFLRDEYRWIADCIAAGLPLLGICQGAQMIAQHLGGTVGPKADPEYEFGYYRIDPTPEAGAFLPGPLWVVQAHFHTWTLPPGAIRLAGSAAYPEQAFRWGDRVYGLQFHAEVTPAGFARWQQSKAHLYARPEVQRPEEQLRLQALHDAAQDAWFRGFLDRLFGAAA